MNHAHRPFWIREALAGEASAPPRPLEGTIRAELAIVGAGFTGLWTAILAKQAQPALDVVIIEADLAGAGASGRNGGCVLSWSTKLASLIRLYGEAEGIRLARASEQAILDIDRFVQAHHIDCDWRMHGTLYTATSVAQIGASDAVMDALQTRGLSQWTRLPVDEVRRRAGSRAHLEGWYSPLAATVDPGRLVRGLRRVALAMGVRLYEGTPLSQLSAGQPLTLRTPRGRVVADRAVIAVNAWMGELFPAFRRSIVVVSSDMVITEPNPTALARTGLDRGISVLDSRTFVHYYRSTSDGRVMLGKGGNTFAYGGRIQPSFDAPSSYAESLLQALRRFMPELSDTPMAASWNGPSDRSVTGLPFFGTLPGHTNVWYGLGYSGNGVGPTRMGGEVLASLALGQDNEWTRSPLTHGPLGQFPPEPWRYAGSLLVRNAIRREERAQDASRPVAPWDRWLAGFAASAGKADKGTHP
jgi:putative aminophosphonate oxidoreductase